MMTFQFGLFLSSFSTLLALINPLEALSVFLSLTENVPASQRHSIARRSCLYALGLMLFFLAFGTLILKIFGVPLSMVRVAGGLILVRIGFDLFSKPTGLLSAGGGSGGAAIDVAFVPMAMPIMFGPGGIAAIIGMSSMATHSSSEIGALVSVAVAIVAVMATTWLCLARAEHILQRLGHQGVDAVTRIIGFFVATMGVGLAFDGVFEALQTHGLSH
jgi:multiple antibiotic resistance protein